MRRRDFLVGGAFGFALPLLGASPVRAALSGLLEGDERGLPLRVRFAPFEAGSPDARPLGFAVAPDELRAGDPVFPIRGARVTCHGLVTGAELAAPDPLAVRREGLRGVSVELEYPAPTPAGARLQRFWSFADRGVPNVGRSCSATLPIDAARGLALHLAIEREGRPGAGGVLRLSPGREVGAPKLRRGRYLLSVSNGTGILVEVDHAGEPAGDPRAPARA